LITQSLLTLLTAAALFALQPRALTATSVMGTYGLDTRHLPSSTRDGCWLEVAPLTTDSVRVQVRCTLPAPSHHIGVIDEHLLFKSAVLVYETNQYSGHCRIEVRFGNANAVVTQEGDAGACGLGANVNLGGEYRRISRRRPSFDLAPIAR
jgi:hypothetical protein